MMGGMETAIVAQQTHYIEGKPIRISLLAFLVIGVYAVLWSRKRKSRRHLRLWKRKKSQRHSP